MCLGIPGRIVAITVPQHKLGAVEIMGVRREINLACVVAPGTALEDYVGRWVLVHVGFAMSCIDAEEAARTLEILDQLGELQASATELGAMP
jgi:hydrogenase expression/formation protein HypC